jgi:uncharacterized protein
METFTPEHVALIQQVEQFVKHKMEGLEAGHDWWHVFRVRNNALKICETEGGDKQVVELAALLHDLTDTKFFDAEREKLVVVEFLKNLGLMPELIAKVFNVIDNLSFSGELEGKQLPSLEAMIVQDADRLDAMGAIGIARAFSYGAHKNRPFFDPHHLPVCYESATAYRQTVAPTINHFFEKLLLLKHRMKTTTGRQFAEERHQFLIQYLTQFFEEWGFDHEDELTQWLELVQENEK